LVDQTDLSDDEWEEPSRINNKSHEEHPRQASGLENRESRFKEEMVQLLVLCWLLTRQVRSQRRSQRTLFDGKAGSPRKAAA